MTSYRIATLVDSNNRGGGVQMLGNFEDSFTDDDDEIKRENNAILISASLRKENNINDRMKKTGSTMPLPTYRRKILMTSRFNHVESWSKEAARKELFPRPISKAMHIATSNLTSRTVIRQNDEKANLPNGSETKSDFDHKLNQNGISNKAPLQTRAELPVANPPSSTNLARVSRSANGTGPIPFPPNRFGMTRSDPVQSALFHHYHQKPFLPLSTQSTVRPASSVMTRSTSSAKEISDSSVDVVFTVDTEESSERIISPRTQYHQETGYIPMSREYHRPSQPSIDIAIPTTGNPVESADDLLGTNTYLTQDGTSNVSAKQSMKYINKKSTPNELVHQVSSRSDSSPRRMIKKEKHHFHREDSLQSRDCSETDGGSDCSANANGCIDEKNCYGKQPQSQSQRRQQRQQPQRESEQGEYGSNLLTNAVLIWDKIYEHGDKTCSRCTGDDESECDDEDEEADDDEEGDEQGSEHDGRGGDHEKLITNSMNRGRTGTKQKSNRARDDIKSPTTDEKATTGSAVILPSSDIDSKQQHGRDEDTVFNSLEDDTTVQELLLIKSNTTLTTVDGNTVDGSCRFKITSSNTLGDDTLTTTYEEIEMKASILDSNPNDSSTYQVFPRNDANGTEYDGSTLDHNRAAEFSIVHEVQDVFYDCTYFFRCLKQDLIAHWSSNSQHPK